ncbi:MAG: thioredoxin family protein [Candidatus Brockarchaeota archaeon]|nr:thioredoxin family protein [Candidatus Brockarchaeota archaeon]
MKVKLFYREECGKCPPAKEACARLEERGIKVEYFDVDTVEGMAEAAFYEVAATPTAIVVDEGGKEVASWRGRAPDEEAVVKLQGRG